MRRAGWEDFCDPQEVGELLAALRLVKGPDAGIEQDLAKGARSSLQETVTLLGSWQRRRAPSAQWGSSSARSRWTISKARCVSSSCA